MGALIVTLFSLPARSYCAFHFFPRQIFHFKPVDGQVPSSFDCLENKMSVLSLLSWCIVCQPLDLIVSITVLYVLDSTNIVTSTVAYFEFCCLRCCTIYCWPTIRLMKSFSWVASWKATNENICHRAIQCDLCTHWLMKWHISKTFLSNNFQRFEVRSHIHLYCRG